VGGLGDAGQNLWPKEAGHQQRGQNNSLTYIFVLHNFKNTIFLVVMHYMLKPADIIRER
jgi:hypothetical protein